MTRFEKISVFNIILTLILSAIAVFLSYNSYKTSENTFLLSEKIEKLNRAQANNELKSAASTLFTTINMLHQNDSEGKNLGKFIQTLNEMKGILESQMKNLYLAQNKEISDLWVEFYSRLNFDIKFLEEGLKPNTSIAGGKDILSELDQKADEIFKKILQYEVDSN